MRALGKNSSSARRPGPKTAAPPGARADNHRFGKPVRARATGRTHDLSATAPYTTGAGVYARSDGLACKRVCAVGWFDERLGLGPRVMDMPHEVTGEGQDDVGTKTGHARRRRLTAGRERSHARPKRVNTRRKHEATGRGWKWRSRSKRRARRERAKNGPKRDPVPPGVGPRGRSIRGKQRVPCASSAETSVSWRTPGETAYHMDFLRSSKTPEGTIQKTARTPGRGGCPSGILGGEGSVG